MAAGIFPLLWSHGNYSNTETQFKNKNKKTEERKKMCGALWTLMVRPLGTPSVQLDECFFCGSIDVTHSQRNKLTINL